MKRKIVCGCPINPMQSIMFMDKDGYTEIPDEIKAMFETGRCKDCGQMLKVVDK